MNGNVHTAIHNEDDMYENIVGITFRQTLNLIKKLPANKKTVLDTAFT